MNPHNDGCTPDNQNKYMLEKFAQMINEALGKMTETIGNIFKTTLSEFTNVYQGDESDSNESSSCQASSAITHNMFSKRNSVSIKLPAFKGEVDDSCKAYINRFEAGASYNGWGDRQR